jgi:hypothetical protein
MVNESSELGQEKLNVVFKSLIANMATLQFCEVMSNKVNVDRICRIRKKHFHKNVTKIKVIITDVVNVRLYEK